MEKTREGKTAMLADMKKDEKNAWQRHEYPRLI